MAITIKPDGAILVDTPEELRVVLDIQAERASAAKPPAAPAVPPPAPMSAPAASTPQPIPSRFPVREPSHQAEVYREFYRQMEVESPQQQRLIDHLIRREMTDSELRLALGLSRNQDLRGLLIGIVRRAHNRKLPGVVGKQVGRVGRKRTYVYSLTPEFRDAVEGIAGRGQEKLAI